jgi:salicylate hydroxylase
MMGFENDILVVGAGIGGLTFALAAQQRGATVRVIEQAPQLSEVGAGLQISPNGFYVLDKLGLSQDLDDVAFRAQTITLRDYARGDHVATLNLQKYGASIGYRFFHRADLLDVLYQACLARGIRVDTNCPVTEILDQGTAVDTPQGIQRAGVIVGADGINSLCRSYVLGPNDRATFTGQVAWRAIVPKCDPTYQWRPNSYGAAPAYR